MADDWDQLATEYKDHELVAIGQVDCTSDDGKPICDDFEVQGFPTLIYGDPMSADTYEEEDRSLEALQAFAKETLTQKICSMYRMENCDAERSKLIKDLQSKSNEELDKLVQTVEALVQKEQDVFDEKVEDIQKQYDTLVRAFNDHLDEIKAEHHFKYLEQIMNARAMNEPSLDDEDFGSDEF